MLFIYVFSCIFLISSLSINLNYGRLNNLVSSFIYLFIINSIISILCLVLKFKVSELLLSIIYLILSFGLFSLYCYNPKSNQVRITCYFSHLYLLLISLLTIVIFYYRFKCGTVIAFETTDPVVHYDMFKTFYSSKQLLLSEPSKIYPWMSDYPSLFYVNIGVFYYIFSFMPDWQFYIIFNLFLFLLASYKFYHLLLASIKESMSKNIIAIIIALYFSCSYLLNLVLFGFSSQLIALVVILEFLFVCSRLYSNQTSNFKLQIIHKVELNLLLVGTLVGYYYYFPELLVGLFLFILVSEKIKDAIVDLLSSLIVPILVFVVLFIIYKAHPKGGESFLLKSEGYIFKSFYCGLLIFIPMFIVNIYQSIKLKKAKFEDIILVVSLLFSVCLFMLCLIGKASSYYFYKNYLVLYVLILFSGYNFIVKNKLIYYWFIVFILSIILWFLMPVLESARVNSKNITVNNLLVNQNMLAFNYINLIHPKIILSLNDIYLISADKRCNVFYKTADVLQSLWTYNISGCYPKLHKDKDAFTNIYNLYKNENILPKGSGISVVDISNHN